ncbi:MAG: hypothetical protein ACYC2U_04610 [Candidatus Amoebophilus sp.]
MMRFKLLAPALELLEKYKDQRGAEKDDFVFPILNKHEYVTPQQISNRINRLLRQVNAALKELAEEAKVLRSPDNLRSALYLCDHAETKWYLHRGDE